MIAYKPAIATKVSNVKNMAYKEDLDSFLKPSKPDYFSEKAIFFIKKSQHASVEYHHKLEIKTVSQF